MINSWKNIKHVVFWSGGFDSTALLIETTAKYATYNEPVLAISVYDKDAISNADADKAAREKIKQILIDKHHLNIKFHEIQTSWLCNDMKEQTNEDIYFDYNRPSFWLGQAYYWFSVVVQHFIGCDIDIHLAYVQEDDFWHIRHNIVNALKTLLPEHNCRLNYDYESKHKDTIYRELRNFDTDIFNACNYCECLKDGKPCGECASCNKHLKTMFWLDYQDKQLKDVPVAVDEAVKEVEHIHQPESAEPAETAIADYNDVMNVTKDEHSMTLDEYAESWGEPEPECEPAECEVEPPPEPVHHKKVKRKK